MNGNVTYNGSQLLSGAINVNTTGNIQALNVQVTENGERTITPPEGVDGYAPITIDTNVPIPEPVLDSISITQNGTYTPPSGTDGYNEITVDVPQLEPVLDDITITENGTYTPPSGVDGYDEVNVSVPTPEPVLDTLNVTSNGTYTPPSGVDGYDEVNVSVSGYTIKTLSTTPTSIASFTDGTANPLKSLTASIVPVQAGSGDPSPTNVRPISGWTEEVVSVCGVNYFDKNTIQNGYVNDANGIVDSGGNGKCTDYIKVLPNTAYYIKSEQTSGMCGAWYDENKQYISGVTGYANSVKTSPNNARYIRLTVLYAGNGNVDTFGFNYPSTDTEYHAYNGTTTTIPFTDGQGQSVEVFGGSVDVVNGGEQPNPYNVIDLSTLNWSKSGTGNKFVATLSDAVRFPTSSSTSIADLICSNYKTVSGKDCYDATNDYAIGGAYYNNTNRLIVNDIDKYNTMTAEEFTTAMQGVQLRYELATPTTFYTQPTSIKSLEGDNNVWASTGDVEELKYFANL